MKKLLLDAVWADTDRNKNLTGMRKSPIDAIWADTDLFFFRKKSLNGLRLILTFDHITGFFFSSSPHFPC